MNTQGDILDVSQMDLEGDFDAQVAQIFSVIRLSRQEVEDLEMLRSDLQTTFSKPWPGCKVYPFGSIVTGLGIRTSDVDCYVWLPDWVQNNKQLVFKAKHILEYNRHLFRNLFAIGRAKVPIVKFFHVPTERNCDVNFKSFSGVRNSNLIAYLLHIDSRALPLAILIKYWSKVHNLTGTNLMPNYCLTLLVIFFLQQMNILPPVQLLQKDTPEYFVENWNTSFREGDYDFQIDKSLSLYQLLGGFFDYYKKFDFKNNVISPYLGCSLRKNIFNVTEQVPAEFRVYKQNIASGVSKPLKVDTNLCVQDPFDHSRNCSVAVNIKLFIKIMSLFASSAKMFHQEDSNGFLKGILTIQQSKEDVVPKVHPSTLPYKVHKPKRLNNIQQNIQNKVHLIYQQFRKDQSGGQKKF